MADIKQKSNKIFDEKQKRTSHIFERLRKMESAKNEYSKHWIQYERLWKVMEDERTGDDAWRANLPDTLSYATVKTAQAAFLDSQVTPIFKKHEDEDESKSKDLTDLYTDNSQKGDQDIELYYARLDAFKLGNGFTETIYLKDEREVNEIIKFDPDTDSITYKKKKVKDFDDVKTRRVSSYLMFVDEMTRADFATARDCIKLEILGFDDAKRLYGHLIPNFDEAIPKAGGLRSMQAQITKSEIAETRDDNTREDTSLRKFRFFAPVELADDSVEIIHYWNKIEDTYEIVANGKPLRVKTNKDPSPIPYIHKQLPFSAYQYSPYSGDEFWCAGIIEVGRMEAKASRQNREMMSDRQKVSLFAPVIADQNSEIDQKQLRLKPLSIITSRGGKVSAVQIPGITNADLALAKNYEDTYKRAVGIDERLLGATAGKSRITATEVSFLREASLARLREFMFLYKKALIREIRLKLKLFEQYYASPIKRESIVKQDSGVKQLKVKIKEFKINTGNVYKSKAVYESMFQGDIEDVDLDLQLLVPMTPAQLTTRWAQVLRDIVPLKQQGLVNANIDKIAGKYLDTLGVNIESLRENIEGEAIKMAEGEHKLLANANTSDATLGVLPEGTPFEFLTAIHIKKHNELLRTDDQIGEREIMNLAKHIAKDVENLRKKMEQERVQRAQMAAAAAAGMAQIGGVTPPAVQPAPARIPAGGLPAEEGGIEIPSL